MSPDILAVLAGVVAAAVYIVCSRSMAAAGANGGRGGGGSGGGGRSAGGGRASIPTNGGTGKATGGGKTNGVPPAGKANSGRTGKGSNWNADGTHGSNYDKGKAGTQGSKGAAGKAAAAGSGKVTMVRGNAHGSNISVNDDGSSKVSDAASAVTDLVSNTAAPGNDNDGGNLAGGDFGDVPVTGTTSVSFDANGDIVTDERAGSV